MTDLLPNRAPKNSGIVAESRCCVIILVRLPRITHASSEPISADNPLLSAPHCIITPHISWASRESRARLMGIAAENLRAFQAGNPQNVVS